MTRAAAAALAAAACGMAVTAAESPLAEDVGPVDPETWLQVGAPVWRFDSTGSEAGPEPGSGFLVSPGRYADFRLRMEFFIEDDTNSGVFVRCGEVTVAENVNPFDCYEINIYDNHPRQEARTGAVVRHVPPSSHVNTLDRWNTLEIVARGHDIEVTVNGVRTARLENARSSAGPIALQYAGNRLFRFRRLEIEPGS